MIQADQLEKDIEVYQRTAELTQCNATLTRVYDAVNDWSALGLHCIEPGGALWSLPWETPSVQALLDCCASTLEPYSFCSPYSANIEHSYPVWLDCLCRECESPIRAPQVFRPYTQALILSLSRYLANLHEVLGSVCTQVSVPQSRLRPEGGLVCSQP